MPAISGAGLYALSSNQDLIFNGCTVTKNVAAYGGGGLYLYSSNNYINITNSSFDGNAATLGGALFVSGDNTYFSGNSFVSNVASTAGGAIYVVGANDAEYMYLTFTNNSSPISGGAIYLSSNTRLSIRHSVFKNQTAEVGGAIYFGFNNNYVTWKQILCAYNIAISQGGCAYIAVTNKNLEFEENIVLENIGGYGGGIYLAEVDTLTIGNTQLVRNRASFDGGGIYALNTKNSVLLSLNFSENTAVSGAALYLSTCQNNVVKDSLFYRNIGVGKGKGSAMWLSSCPIITQSNKFIENEVPSGRGTGKFLEFYFIIQLYFSPANSEISSLLVYWQFSSGMSEPPGLSELNMFEGNIAENGPTFATEEVSMAINGREYHGSASRSLRSASCLHMSGKYDDSLPEISVDLVDYYDQFYPVDSDALVEASSINFNDCGERAAKVNLCYSTVMYPVQHS